VTLLAFILQKYCTKGGQGSVQLRALSLLMHGVESCAHCAAVSTRVHPAPPPLPPSPSKSLQERLYLEMRGRIKEDDCSVPSRQHGWVAKAHR